jgi:hypothetical protein
MCHHIFIYIQPAKSDIVPISIYIHIPTALSPVRHNVGMPDVGQNIPFRHGIAKQVATHDPTLLQDLPQREPPRQGVVAGQPGERARGPRFVMIFVTL